MSLDIKSKIQLRVETIGHLGLVVLVGMVEGHDPGATGPELSGDRPG
jgi:hypothetical protein